MTDQADTAARPARLSSKDDVANELIAALREQLATTAKGIAELGDRAHVAEGGASATEALHAAEAAEQELMAWRDLLEDYGRGIIDREELLRRTVGYV